MLEVAISLANDGVWHFGPTFWGIFVDIEDDSRRGPPKKWPEATILMCLSSQCCKQHSTLQALVYGVLMQMLLGESGFKFLIQWIFIILIFQICTHCNVLFLFLLTFHLQNVEWINLYFFSYVFHESMSWMLIELGWRQGNALGGKIKCHGLWYLYKISPIPRVSYDNRGG